MLTVRTKENSRPNFRITKLIAYPFQRLFICISIKTLSYQHDIHQYGYTLTQCKYLIKNGVTESYNIGHHVQTQQTDQVLGHSLPEVQQKVLHLGYTYKTNTTYMWENSFKMFGNVGLKMIYIFFRVFSFISLYISIPLRSWR